MERKKSPTTQRRGKVNGRRELDAVAVGHTLNPNTEVERALLVDGSADALAELWRTLEPWIRAEARRYAQSARRDRVDFANELVSDVALQFPRLPAIYRGGNVRALVRTIIYTSAIDRHRRAFNRVEEALETGGSSGDGGDHHSIGDAVAFTGGRLVDPDPSPEARLMATERARALRRAITTLLDARSARVVLRSLDDSSPAEIAAEEGLTVSHVNVIMCRARTALRAAFSTPLADLARQRARSSAERHAQVVVDNGV